MIGGYSRADFEHCEVALFLGKNPWFSHSIPRARTTLREIAKDPARCLIVVDPRRTETAEIADIHLQVRPGTDAWLLAALVGVLVQEDLIARAWLAEHADGLDDVLPHFAALPIADYCAACGVPEETVRATARRIAAASSMATFEDLGVQMNRYSTLVSYLHKLLVLLTGNFGKQGAGYMPVPFVPLATGKEGGGGARRTPVTGARVIGGLTPCNVIPEEILTDHPKRYRAMLVESGNPAHSLADSTRMREALAALDLVVVIDVAFTETARLGALRASGGEPVREGGGDVLQLRVPAQLLPSAQGADAAAARAVLGGRAPRAAGRGARSASGRRRRAAARGVARGAQGVPRQVPGARGGDRRT